MATAPAHPLRVLLVEDDAKLASLVERGIRSQGWDCEVVGSGDEALRALGAGHGHELVVLDRTLPGVDGLHVCRTLRDRGDSTPIIMLTARASIDERVTGLDAGADDYVTKPFALRELYARIRAQVRGAGELGTPPDDDVVVAGPVRLDVHAGELHAGPVAVQLRPQECTFLALLMRAGGRPVTRERLASELWPEQEFPSENQLDVLVARVRRRLEPIDDIAITTRRGVGYCLRVPA